MAAEELITVGTLDEWSLSFIYVDGEEPPRWRAGQPLHGAEVSISLAPPLVVEASDAEDELEFSRHLPQRGADMVRRNGVKPVSWAAVAALEAVAAQEEAEAAAAEATAAEEEVRNPHLTLT